MEGALKNVSFDMQKWWLVMSLLSSTRRSRCEGTVGMLKIRNAAFSPFESLNQMNFRARAALPYNIQGGHDFRASTNSQHKHTTCKLPNRHELDASFQRFS